jgi:hypothetical protein
VKCEWVEIPIRLCIYKNNVTRNKALSATGYQELKTYIRGIEIEGHIEKQTKKDEKQP